MRAAVSAIAAVALGAAVITAQGDARFSARSELVILDVAVTDKRGAFVKGLPAESFHVFEEGHRTRQQRSACCSIRAAACS